MDQGDFWLALLARDAQGKYQGLAMNFSSSGTLIRSSILRSPDQFYLYALDVNSSGNLVAFGNTTGPGDYSVIIEIDDNSVIVQSKRILFTVIWGNFMATSDGGYMCRSGTVYYKVRSDFSVEWTRLIPKYYATREPVEVSDGYIFSIAPYASSNPDQNMMIKFDFEGGLLWQSENFGSIAFTNIKLLSNGNIMQIGNGFPEFDLPSHVVFTEINPTGELVRQKAFNPDLSREMSGNDFIQLENGSFVFVGKADSGGEILHGMTTPRLSLLCGDFYSVQRTPSEQITMTPHTSDVSDQEMTIINIEAVFQEGSVSRDRFCFENVLTLPEIPPDTILCSGDSLIADFRITNYEVIWDDGSDMKYRALKAPGTYGVTFRSCAEEVQETIILDAIDCRCVFYFPNVITPNRDGINDRFKVLSDCVLADYQMTIYNRWGTQVFKSENPEEEWPQDQGKYDVNPGVYIACINFTAIENNQKKEYTFAKDITVLR
jgi:gliding motility-associated-like protein